MFLVVKIEALLVLGVCIHVSCCKDSTLVGFVKLFEFRDLNKRMFDRKVFIYFLIILIYSKLYKFHFKNFIDSGHKFSVKLKLFGF